MSTSNPPRAYHHGDLRNALILAGLALLNEEGMAALDLRKVARRAGVSHAAPYRHFADKQALVAAINEHGFQRLTEALQHAIEGAGRQPKARLRAGTQAYIAFALAQPALAHAMFSGLTLDRNDYPSLYAASKQAFGGLIGVIAEGQQRGVFVKGDPTLIALTVWSLVHGMAILIIERQYPPEKTEGPALQKTLDTALQHLIEGIAMRP